MDFKNNRIGVLGGTFDPAHKGHLAISKDAFRRFKLKKVIWAITEKNPLKKQSKNYIFNRVKHCKKIIGKNSFIEVKFYEKIIKSNKTYKLILYLNRNKKNEIYFLMGADNLINFHRWYKWKEISKRCKIIVFDRNGFKAKAKKSIAYKSIKNKGLTYVEFKKVNISSSKIRNF